MQDIQGIQVSRFTQNTLILAVMAGVFIYAIENLGTILLAIGSISGFLGIAFGLYMVWQLWLKPVFGKKT